MVCYLFLRSFWPRSLWPVKSPHFLDLLRHFTMQGFKFTWTSLQEVGWCSPRCNGYRGINWESLRSSDNNQHVWEEKGLSWSFFLLQLITAKRTWNLTRYFQCSDYHNSIPFCESIAKKTLSYRLFLPSDWKGHMSYLQGTEYPKLHKWRLRLGGEGSSQGREAS